MPANPKSQNNLQPLPPKYGEGIKTRPIRVPEQLIPDILHFIENRMNSSTKEDLQSKPTSPDTNFKDTNINSIEASEDAESSRIKIKNDALPSINIILFQDSRVCESTISSIHIDQISISFQGLP